MGHFRKATIKDVAARSGVSTTTVSNFVSGNTGVCSKETADRIRQAISALHYVPSSLTRGLRQRPTTTIGVCLPYPLDSDVFFGFFFLERLWRGILEQADEEGYALLHYPRSVREDQGISDFLDGRVDGILLRAEDNLRALPLASAGMPTILVTRSLEIPDGCGAVWADETQTIRLALDHLREQGHRRIAHIAGPLSSAMLELEGPADLEPACGADIAVQRWRAYRAWMRAHRWEDPALIAYPQAWSAPQAEVTLRAWRALPSPPTAVFCANDAQALDLLAAARGLGLCVPEDLSIVGVDNAPESYSADPPLTSVVAPMEQVGREAMRALLRRIQGAPIEACRIAVPVTEFQVRGSTGPCRV